MFWSIILLKYLNQRGDSVLISCDVLSLYLQRSYLFYCKHVTANPCVCSASTERSESKHTRTGAQTSYALYACRRNRPLCWPSRWLYPDLRPWEFENSAYRNSAYRRTMWPLITPLRVTLRRKHHPLWIICLLPRQNCLSAISLMSLLDYFQHFSVSPFLAINMNEGRHCARFVNSSD